MIKHFGNIRKKLVIEGKINNYLKYAIGEIVLVVIGILIALQINNWNEQRKSKEDEIATLQNFSENLQNDLLWFNLSSKYIDKSKNSMALLLSWMEEDLPYRDSLKYHFGNTNNLITPSINTSPFESLKSKNLNLISSKDLR